MPFLFRLKARVWLLFPLCALVWLVWTNRERAERVEAVTNTDNDTRVIDVNSPTGYAGGKRWLIVPERNHHSYQLIAETQQMLAHGEWRIRRIDSENTPLGREVHTAALPHWWLAGLAWSDHTLSGRSLGLAVENASLFSEPLWQGLVLLVTTFFIVRRFGIFPAALFSVGWVFLFPLGSAFLPGVPDQTGLSLTFALWSLLPLVASRGVANETKSRHRRIDRDFFAAGVAGGCGLWVSAADQLPVLSGIVFGAILAAVLAHREAKNQTPESPPALPWRIWALGGATTCLLAYLLEYFPSHMALRLQVNHPLYGVAWLGAGEVLAGLTGWTQKKPTSGRLRIVLGFAFGMIAIAALPITLVLTQTHLFQVWDLLASRLTFLTDGVTAKNSLAWLLRDGLTLSVWATWLPLTLFVPAIWLLAQRKIGLGPRTGLAIALGPALVAVVSAFFQVHEWAMAGALLLGLAVAVTAASPRPNLWRWGSVTAVILFVGLVRLLPASSLGNPNSFTRTEAEDLIERALAHWLADHAGPRGATILAPPDRTPSWCFHGGLRGLGTANWENHEGLAATVRIVTATTAEAAQDGLSRRGVNYIVLPSWDNDLDEFARWTLRNPEDGFIMALHHWSLPPWLRPLPYKLPSVPGFEDQSVAIFEVTDETNRVAALGRLAEYFIETQQLDLASSTVEALRRYPTDLGALIALAEVEKSRGDEAGFAKTFRTLLTSVTGGFDRALTWDQRVSLAVVLAQGQRNELARDEIRRCLETVSEPRIRSLTTGSLFRLQLLSQAFGLPIADPKLHTLAQSLLPPELKNHLQ